MDTNKNKNIVNEDNIDNGYIVFHEKGEQSGTKNEVVEDDGDEGNVRRLMNRDFDFVERTETRKALSPDKLAELWATDPKRAKRIITNRKSAARSKERKERYTLELERKLQILQMEATIISAKLTHFQRNTSDLATENNMLKLFFKDLEQEVWLRDELHERVKREMEMLKNVSGEGMTPTESDNFGMQHSYAQSPLFPQNLHMQQSHLGEPSNFQMFPVHQFQHELSIASQPSQMYCLPDVLQQNPSGQV